MNLVEQVAKQRSVAVVGLAKNAGKTETLNYLLRGLQERGGAIGVTSIGVDGEREDAVYGTHKPDIYLHPGTLFTTSERHYRQRRLRSEILDISTCETALGRLVTARVVDPGTVVLSGPATTAELKRCIDAMGACGAETVLVDGALSRLSLASPAVTDALVLATGGAVARSIAEVVRKTKYVCDLINLPLGEEGEKIEGMLGDNALEKIRLQPEPQTLVVQDFTRIFASPETFYAAVRKGVKITVERRPVLLGVTINPSSPDGYTLDGERLKHELKETLNLPVYNVKCC